MIEVYVFLDLAPDDSLDSPLADCRKKPKIKNSAVKFLFFFFSCCKDSNIFI